MSQPELLLDKANELFGQARQTAGGKDVVDWPLPQINADGSELVEDAKPFGEVVWNQEEYWIFGGSDEAAWCEPTLLLQLPPPIVSRRTVIL